MGELKSTLDLHLPSTNRGASTVQQVMARNQVNLLRLSSDKKSVKKASKLSKR